MPVDFTAPHSAVYARDPASKPTLLQGALEGHVLVKNTNKSLPLQKPKLLSIFGYDAVAPPAMTAPTDFLSPFTFGYESQLGFSAFVSSVSPPQIAQNGTIISGGWYLLNCPI
jgi:beta-glucosidase